MKKFSLPLLVFVLSFGYSYAQEKKSNTSLQNQPTLEQKIDPIFKRPEAFGVMASTEKAGMTYQLIYRTGTVELLINGNKTQTDTIMVGKFVTLSTANGGAIYGTGEMKWIGNDIHFTVNAGQQFGGKVAGLFKWNSKTKAVTQFLFKDEPSTKKVKKKQLLKTRTIKTLRFTDHQLLQQYQYQLSQWDDKKATANDRKRHQQELEEYNFWKAHSQEPYYLFEETPKYALEAKNIFADGNRDIDTALLQNAEIYMNKVLNQFDQPPKHQVKVLGYFLADRTGFNGVYFLYQEKDINEVKIIRYNNSECAWLLSNYVEL